MAKWNKDTFFKNLKESCMPHITNIVIDLVRYTDEEADSVSWGRGEGYGTMTFKCKSDDYGFISL